MTLSNRLVVAIGVAIAIAAGSASPACYAFDSHTARAWKRTFNARNAFDQPLRPYFIPRRPGDCRPQACGVEPACQPSPAIGLEPRRFERLGHIPNVLAGGAAAGR